jgi:hypothetical protein
MIAVLLACSVSTAGTIRQPSGYFVMQGVHSQTVKDSMLATPSLAGIHIRDEWALVQPTSSGYSFAWMDAQVSRAAKLGKQVTLGIYAGQNSPTWLGAPLVGGAPLPWDPKVDAAFVGMVSQLGQRYAANPAIAAVHMSSPATAYSMEMYLPTGLTKTPGYSDQRIIDVWKQSIDAYNAAFPTNALVLDLAMVPDARGAITKAVDEYARQTLGARFNAIICNLKATTPTTAPHFQELKRLHSEGVRIGFEMVAPSTDSRFGGTFAQAIAIGDAAGSSWYQIYQLDVPKISSRLFATQVPEPSTVTLLASAAALLIFPRKRRCSDELIS